LGQSAERKVAEKKKEVKKKKKKGRLGQPVRKKKE